MEGSNGEFVTERLSFNLFFLAKIAFFKDSFQQGRIQEIASGGMNVNEVGHTRVAWARDRNLLKLHSDIVPF